MIFSIRERFEPIKQLEVDHLRNPLSDRIEPMTLVIYQVEVDMAFFTKVSKKLVAGFYDGTTGKEIPKRKWTGEMKDFFDTQKSDAVINPPKVYYTWFGRIFFLLVVLGIGFLGFEMYKIAVDGNDQRDTLEALKGPAQEGDLYFGAYTDFTKDSPSSGWSWLKISRIDNDTLFVQLGVDNQYKASSEPSEYNAVDFEEAVHKVSATGGASKVEYRAYNGQFNFTVSAKK